MKISREVWKLTKATTALSEVKGAVVGGRKKKKGGENNRKAIRRHDYHCRGSGSKLGRGQA